jgi:hypothetical protein
MQIIKVLLKNTNVFVHELGRDTILLGPWSNICVLCQNEYNIKCDYPEEFDYIQIAQRFTKPKEEITKGEKSLFCKCL